MHHCKFTLLLYSFYFIHVKYSKVNRRRTLPTSENHCHNFFFLIVIDFRTRRVHVTVLQTTVFSWNCFSISDSSICVNVDPVLREKLHYADEKFQVIYLNFNRLFQEYFIFTVTLISLVWMCLALVLFFHLLQVFLVLSLPLSMFISLSDKVEQPLLT